MTTSADLEALLYRHDPIGLVDHGVPADEYRPEAESIYARLNEAQSAGDVQRILHEEFTRFFTPELAGDAARYAAAADELWAAAQPAQ